MAPSESTVVGQLCITVVVFLLNSQQFRSKSVQQLRQLTGVTSATVCVENRNLFLIKWMTTSSTHNAFRRQEIKRLISLPLEQWL